MGYDILYSAVIIITPLCVSCLFAVDRRVAPVIPCRAVPAESNIIPSQDGSKMTAISSSLLNMTYIKLDRSSSSLMEWVSSLLTSVESIVSRIIENDIPS